MDRRIMTTEIKRYEEREYLYLAVSVYYDKGRCDTMSRERGIYVSITPVVIKDDSRKVIVSSDIATSGFNFLFMKDDRFNPKRIEKLYKKVCEHSRQINNYFNQGRYDDLMEYIKKFIPYI